MKVILTPNTNDPYNLIKISLPYDALGLDGQSYPYGRHTTEQAMIDAVIIRHREVGIISGPYYVVDESELPDDKLFDAWYWDDGVKVNLDKASRLGLVI